MNSFQLSVLSLESSAVRKAAPLLLIFYFLVCSLAGAADVVGIQARVWPKEAKLGDEIKVIVDVTRPSDVKIQPLSLRTVLEPFEIKKIDVRPSVPTDAGLYREQYVLTLTVFELGDLSIAPISIYYTDNSGQTLRLQTQPLKIKISGVARRSSDKDDIRPIKGPWHLETQVFWNWIYGILAGILSIILGIKIILRKLKKRLEDSESLKPPHERAFLELERLRKKGYLEENKAKEFYSELADILRVYLERRFGIEALELTTVELMPTLKAQPIERSCIENIRDFFEKSDLVKFAKYQPPRLWGTALPELFCQIVDATKPPPPQPKKTKRKAAA